MWWRWWWWWWRENNRNVVVVVVVVYSFTIHEAVLKIGWLAFFDYFNRIFNLIFLQLF